MLRRELRGIDVVADMQADEVMHLAAEGVVGMQLDALDQDQTVGRSDAGDAGDAVVVGDRQEVVAVGRIGVGALLR